MLLKVGQLAKQVSLSVRTLHHYDEIGLLSPSVVLPLGTACITARMLRFYIVIQASNSSVYLCKKLLKLFQKNSQSLPDIIAQQISAIDREVDRAQLKSKLVRLQGSLQAGHEPDMSWLDTLALMNVYEKYLSADEIEELNNHALAVKHEIEHDWPEMVKKLQAMMDQKTPPDDSETKAFVILWTEMLERLVGHNHLLLKVNAMSQKMEIQLQRGISPAMAKYLGDVMGAIHRDIFMKISFARTNAVDG